MMPIDVIMWTIQAVSPFVTRYVLGDMKDIVTCLAYLRPDASHPEPVLCIGDDGGHVFVLHFLKHSQSLFKKTGVDDVQHINWRVFQSYLFLFYWFYEFYSIGYILFNQFMAIGHSAVSWIVSNFLLKTLSFSFFFFFFETQENIPGKPANQGTTWKRPSWTQIASISQSHRHNR